MNQIEVQGTATLSGRVKHSKDGSIDYAIIEINGQSIHEFLGSLLVKGSMPDEEGYTNIESAARIHIVIEPKSLSTIVIEPTIPAESEEAAR